MMTTLAANVPRKLFVCICGAGILAGSFLEPDGLTAGTAAQHRQGALFGFYFGLVAIVLVTVMERLFAALVRVAQKSGGDPVNPPPPRQLALFAGFAWFILAIGCGLAISACWRGVDLAWGSLELAGPATGLLLGLKIRSLLLQRFSRNRPPIPPVNKA